jgi:hypothetical protein
MTQPVRPAQFHTVQLTVPRDGALCDHRAGCSRRCCRFGVVLRVMVVPAVVAGCDAEELP